MHFLRRTAREIRQYKVSMKISRIILIMLVTITTLIYVSAALYKKTGSFTVSIDKMDMSKYGLTLSETPDFYYQTSHLNADIVEDITNISESWIDPNVDQVNGQHNGDNYIAYTFYLLNAGENEVAYEYSIGISNITNNLDEAIRIKLYVDGSPTTYAKTRSDGLGPELGTTAFYSSVLAASERVDGFAPEEVTKFTVVIWIEGDDRDCIDDLIGGRLRVDLNFKVVY